MLQESGFPDGGEDRHMGARKQMRMGGGEVAEPSGTASGDPISFPHPANKQRLISLCIKHTHARK